MYLKDRVPKYPNRKKIVFEDDGSTRYATIEYADEPAEDGSPINALTLDSIVPNGAILMWSGEETNIPDGWALCDGTNGTPDLRGRFIIGSNSKYKVHSQGGSTTINLKHTHEYEGTTKRTPDYAPDIVRFREGDTTGYVFDMPSEEHTHEYSGTTKVSEVAEENIIPPYYALCYIMKITQIASGIE